MDKGRKQVAFTTLGGSFKPIVMFFELTHSLATFQKIINKILQNLINTEKVASFIDNVIVGMEERERYNEVVEKVVKRLVKNNMYVKPEKYK